MAEPNNELRLPWTPFEEFFECIEIDSKNLRAKCKVCVQKNKILSCNILASSNLRKHLVKIHPNRVKELDQKIENCKKIDVSNGRCKQLKLDHYSNSKGNNGVLMPTQAVVDKLIMNFVINSLQHFSICDTVNKGGAAFQKLITSLQPNLTVMCSKTLKSRLRSLLDNTRTKIVQNMMEVSYVSITADCWLAAKRSYIGVTAHWIDSINFERRQAALACQRLKGRHTFNVLASALVTIFENYQIQNKITGATTDNGSNFVKAFTVFGNESEEKRFEESATEVQFIEISNLLNDVETICSSAENIESFIVLPPHYRCASHTLNLVATTDVEKALHIPSFKRISRSCFAKCRAIWNKQNLSTVAADTIKETLGVYLKSPGITRWNSMFDSCNQLNRFINNNDSLEKLNSVCDTLGLPRFLRNERIFLTEYVDVMKPVATVLDLLQKEKNMYLGYLLSTLYQTVSTLRQIKDTRQLQFCLPLVCSLIDGILLRFKSVWGNRSLVVASCVHPKFKMNWSEPNKRETAYNWVIGELNCFHLNVSNSLPTNSQSHTSEDEDDDFFKFPSHNDNVNDSKENELKLLFDNFLKDKKRNNTILTNYGIIKDVFLKYNTTLPSSAAVERMFSVAEDVFQTKRHALTDHNFETQLLLNLNMEYVE